MKVNIRKLRSALGTRSSRRRGTKTKCIPGKSTQKPGPDPKFRYARSATKRPRVRIMESIESIED